MKPSRPHDSVSSRGADYIDGQLLVAMPGMKDTRFARSVIYICAHSADGAMGLVLNQPAKGLAFPELLVQLNVIPETGKITLPDQANSLAVLRGGPVETGRGFVLHSPDFYMDDATLRIHEEISLTATLDILKAIAAGKGPRRAVFALGYAGWSAGQLESEIQANGWLNCEASPDLIFNDDVHQKYDLAIHHMGIDLAMLSRSAGHA